MMNNKMVVFGLSIRRVYEIQDIYFLQRMNGGIKGAKSEGENFTID